MKAKFVLLTVAAVSMFSITAVAPSANAETASRHNCKSGNTYDVMKDKCIHTTGATSYSPHRHHRKLWKKKHKMIVQ
jgi:hypothetical protein